MSIGEIVAQIILLLAFDNARKTIVNRPNESILITMPIQVRDFLISLIGITKFEKFKGGFNCALLDGLVCFTHFERKFDPLNMQDTKSDFIARSAAGQFKPKESVYDLFIPVLLYDNNVTYILIQVKNHAKSPTGYGIAYPRKEYFEGNVIIPFLPILMHVGTNSNPDRESVFLESRDIHIGSERVEISQIIIDGIDKSYPFMDEKIVTVLNQIANCDRNLLESPIYDPRIIKQVGVVNMRKSNLAKIANSQSKTNI